MWLLAAVGLLAVSCMVKEPEQDAMMTDAPKITAMVGTGGAATKVSVTETDGQTRQTFWEKGDEIAVFMHNGRALRYALEGEGGESSGVFSYVSGNGLGLEFPQVYGVYPYGKGIVLDGARVQMDFPGEQAYTADAFDPKANLMVAASESNDLYFQNVGGYLVLELYGADVQVEKVVVKGNAGEPLSGPATIWVYEDDTPEIEIAEETAGKSVTLKCASPVTVGATEADATAFWFVLPPTWFGEGLTVTVFGPDGGTFTRSATGSIDLGRSEVYRLTTEVEMEHLNGHEYVEMAPGLKIATCNVGAQSPEEIGDFFAWGETEPSLSLESTWEDYKWFDVTATDWYVYNAAYGRLTKYATWMYHTEDGWDTYEWVDAGDHLTRLEPEDDAATVNWGGDWRMPTAAQMEYLTGNDFSWTKVTREDAEGNEVAGYEVVSQVPGFVGNTVFFPALLDEDGEYVYYWTADVSDSYYRNSAYSLCSGYGNIYVANGYYRHNPFSVRPFLGVVPVETLTLSQTSMEVPESVSFSLWFDFTPVYASDRFTWSSSDESVATVRQDGYVTAVAPGTAEIIVTAESGMTVSCALTVTEQVNISGKQWKYTNSDGEERILDMWYTNDKLVLFTNLDDDGRYITSGYDNGIWMRTDESEYPIVRVNENGDILYYYGNNDDAYFLNPTETTALIKFPSSETPYEATVVDTPVDIYCPDLVINYAGEQYPMWTSSGFGVDCYGDFQGINMGGATSATLPIYTVLGSDGNMSYGEEADFEGLDLTGKIAVVSRGSISFYIKANNAAAAGASAILIVNNVSGSAHPNMTGMTANIPYFIIPQACYDFLMEAGELKFEEAGTPDYFVKTW